MADRYASRAEETCDVEVPLEDRRRFCLSDAEVAELARYAVVIEEHYTRQTGKPLAMDVEWAKDGITGEARRPFVLSRWAVRDLRLRFRGDRGACC